MTKGKIYTLAVFYQDRIIGGPTEENPKQKQNDYSFTDARYFRDCFASIIKHASKIEGDRKSIVETLKDKDKAKKELEKLFNEEVKGVKLDKNLVSRLEKAGIKLSIGDLSLFD